ncbi:17903_t:CDS:2, partial [Gigaspora rosea]
GMHLERSDCTGKPITLHRPNDGDCLWTHLNTQLHINNKVNADKRIHKKPRTTFLTQFVTSIDVQFDKNKSELKDDALFDGVEKAEGYFKHKNCIGKTRAQFCSVCATLVDNEAFQKRNHRIQTLIAQIDSLILLKEGKEIPQKFYSQFTTSDALKNLLNYLNTELEDKFYYLLIKSYPALGQILEAVETNGLEDWIGKCTAFMINKTMDEQRPAFVGMAQAVTKLLDKMERGVTSMRGIVRWITTNLAGPTIRLICKKRNENNEFFDVHGINSSVFAELITIWRSAYNYYGPTICAKDQTKVAEMIEVCRIYQRWVGSVPIDTSTITYSMTAEELHAKISSFDKATYITVFALTAVLPGIPPLVLAVIPSNQKETKADAFFENNT